MKNSAAILHGSQEVLLDLELALDAKNYRRAIELTCVMVGAMEFLQDEIVKEARNVRNNETVH